MFNNEINCLVRYRTAIIIATITAVYSLLEFIRLAKKFLQKNENDSLIERLKYLLSLIIYADMYDYALRKQDLLEFWEVPKVTLDSTLKKSLIFEADGFVFLPGRKKIVARTKKARQIAETKKNEARKLLGFLIRLPWVKMIALSGSIGALNARVDDDYDVFLIVDRNRKWLVRMLEYFYHGILKKNRAFNKDPHRSNRICANVYIETGSLLLPENKQNLFVAYQSVLVQPIYGSNIYMDFLRVNNWIKNYFGHFYFYNGEDEAYSDMSEKRKLSIWSLPLDVLNHLLGQGQRLKIVISGGELKKTDYPGKLFFHPEDPSDQILQNFEQKRIEVFKAARLDK